MGIPRFCSFTGFCVMMVLLILRSVHAQDPPTFYFPSSNTQSRFVPSPAFQSSRHQSPISFLPGSRGALPQPGSYQEQLVFIDKPQSPQQQALSSAAYAPFGSSFSQTRNSDYYDVSPRPFGVAPIGSGSNGLQASASSLTSSSLSSSSNGFTRSKALRAQQQQQQQQQQQLIRTNVPHQQTQFLAHFNEPNVSNDKPRGSTNNFGSSPARPFGNGGFTPVSNRLRPSANIYKTEGPSPPQQVQPQAPFRNVRNRFQPSSATSTSTTTEEAIPTSSKRYNRFGAGRTQNGGFKPQSYSTTSTTTQSNIPVPQSGGNLQRPSFGRTTNKSNGFQPRRPVFISREINEPVHLAKLQRPFALNSARLKFPTKEKLLKQQVSSTTVAEKPLSNDSESLSYEDNEELNEDNHVGNGKNDPPIQNGSLEKLQLHEGKTKQIENSEQETSSSEAGVTNAPTSKEEAHTVILTSDFYLPDGSIVKKDDIVKDNDEQSTVYSDEESETEEEEDATTNERVTDENSSDGETVQETTTHTPEYEYEYVEEDESTETNTEIKLKDSTVKPATTPATEINTKPETITASVTELEEEQILTTELPATSATVENEITQTPSTTPIPKLVVPDVTEELINKTEETETLLKSDDDEAEYDEENYDEEESEDFIEDKDLKDNEQESISEPTTTEKVVTAGPLKPANEILDRQVISVVTTKSVVNGSTAFPSPVTPSSTTLSMEEQIIFTESKVPPAADSSAEVEELDDVSANETSGNAQTGNNATESYVVIASIQTSRSINGARFLPFPAIEQEETKQTLSELERKIHGQKSKSTKNSKDSSSEQSDSNEVGLTTDLPEYSSEKSSISPSSTESIIDKLDRVQSELSGSLLSGKYPIINEMDVSTQSSTTTSGSKFVPHIRKFQPKTTAAPKVKIHHFNEGEMDELASLLPVGFKPRPSYKNRKLTTTTTTTETPDEDTELKKPARNSTISRSFKNSAVAVQDVSLAGLLPKGYKLPITTTASTTTTTEATKSDIKDIFSKIKFDDNLSALLPKDYKLGTTSKPEVTVIDDISKFLPPGYKLKPSLPTTRTTTKVPLIHDDISKFLPPGYKPPAENSSEQEALPGAGLIALKTVDISKLLPGYKLNGNSSNKSNTTLPESIDISQLLPKDYKPVPTKEKESDGVLPPSNKANTSTTISNNTPSSNSSTSTIPTPTTAGNSSTGYKVVFPKGIHKRIGANRLTTPRTQEEGPTSPAVVIKKGPPTRATTEFTGWPTSSTTPISIEKLLEQAKTASISFDDLLPSTTTTTTTTSTTTTTTTTPRPTKPGHCTSDCDLAATIKIIEGVSWKPELLDHNTLEWKTLAREIELQLNEVYSQAPQLSKWYKKVRIDSFSKGSVLVDYYVELANITNNVNTLEIKKLFHDALTHPPVVTIPDKSDVENETDNEEDDDDIYKGVKEEKLIKETFLMGKYVIDPAATDFSVIPKSLGPTVEYAEEDLLIPQWAIVVIVIGVGSLLFVVVFGVTVLMNRQKRAKKTPIPLTNDMLNELKINHMGGADNYGVDDFYNIDDAWNDTKQPIKPKRFTNSMHGSSGSNIYDSWRSTRHGDYYYDSQNNYSQKGDSLQRAQHHHSHHHHTSSPSQHQYGHQYPDAFADAHQMYTYNNHASRTRFPRDYDPDF